MYTYKKQHIAYIVANEREKNDSFSHQLYESNDLISPFSI